MEIIELKNIVTGIKIHYMGSKADLRCQNKKKISELEDKSIDNLKNRKKNYLRKISKMSAT